MRGLCAAVKSKGQDMSMANVDTIVVHYSATYEDQNLTRADIDKMHKARGWKMVGYHYVIRRDGTVEIGRPETMVGAHVGGKNSGKIGICCIGGLNRATGPNVGVDNRTPEQIESLIRLIKEIRKRHPKAEVVGHRDLAPTQCPGFNVRAWWAKVNKKAAPASAPVAPDAPVKTPDLDEDDWHVVDKGDTWSSVAREHGISLVAVLSMNGAKESDILRIGRKLAVTHAAAQAVRAPKPVPAPERQPTAQPAPAATPEPKHWFIRIIEAIFGARS